MAKTVGMILWRRLRPTAEPKNEGARRGERLYNYLLVVSPLWRVLLRVNHHAFQRIDRAQHLRVARFDRVPLVFRVHAFGTARGKQ